MFNLSY